VWIKAELLHNQLDLQAFIEVISIFKPIDYLCQFFSLPLLILSIDYLNSEEELKQNIV
jgi:hypothetical protein